MNFCTLGFEAFRGEAVLDVQTVDGGCWRWSRVQTQLRPPPSADTSVELVWVCAVKGAFFLEAAEFQRWDENRFDHFLSVSCMFTRIRISVGFLLVLYQLANSKRNQRILLRNVAET